MISVVDKNSPSSSRGLFELVVYLALESLGQAPYFVHKTPRVIDYGIIVNQDAGQNHVSLFLKANRSPRNLSDKDVHDKDQDIKQVVLACQSVRLLGLQLEDVKESSFVVDDKKDVRDYLFLNEKGKQKQLECSTCVFPVDFRDCSVVGEMNTPGFPGDMETHDSLCRPKF